MQAVGLQERVSQVPRLPDPVVRRARLDDALTAGLERGVILVSAPPGAGKTTLLARWLADAPDDLAVAWCTFEPRDDEGDRFAAMVVDALVRAGAASADPGPRAGLAIDVLDDAMRELGRQGRRVVLVLDDIHELTSAVCLAGLSFVADHAPANLTVVIATRADPPLRVGRLRAGGRLCEIRNADLVFRLSEAAELFAAHGLPITHREIAAIHELTEGWACGLRLIAYAMEGGTGPRRFETDRQQAEAAVSDYLLTEVVSRQPEAVQRFLMRTSIVDHLSTDLAVILSDNPGAGLLLEQLERFGVFLFRIDGDMYRYHSLFAALLRALLRQREPQLHRVLHSRAADWYAVHNMTADAEEHARAAEDWYLLGRLVQRRWLEQLLSGDGRGTGLVEGIPDEVVVTTPPLSVVATAAACVAGDRDATRRYSAMWAGDADEEPTVAELMVEVMRGRAFGSDAAAISAATRLARGGHGDPRVRSFGLLRGAELALDRGDVVGVLRDLGELADTDRWSWTAEEADGLMALAHAVEGRLCLADTAAAALLDRRNGNSGFVSPTAALATALTCAQRGQRAAAVAAVGQADPFVPSRPLRAIQRAVEAALVPGRAVGLDAPAARHPAAAMALVALGVLEVVDLAGSPAAVGGPGEAAVLHARHRLETNAFGAVFEAVSPWVADGAAPAHPRTLVEASVLAAIAVSAQGDREGALAHMSGALARAAEERLWAPFIAHGARILDLLDSLVAAGDPNLGEALTMLDELRRMQSPAYVQALTQQERMVLRFLPTLMSNTEIAETMHLSVNTVKTHLKAVYRKLGVERRRDAVIRARQLELLS
jgi:LuxR family maltose regulon positive regulatory protein